MNNSINLVTKHEQQHQLGHKTWTTAATWSQNMNNNSNLVTKHEQQQQLGHKTGTPYNNNLYRLFTHFIHYAYLNNSLIILIGINEILYIMPTVWLCDCVSVWLCDCVNAWLSEWVTCMRCASVDYTVTVPLTVMVRMRWPTGLFSLTEVV